MRYIRNTIIGFLFTLAITTITILGYFLLSSLGWVHKSLNSLLILIGLFNLIIVFTINRKKKNTRISHIIFTILFILFCLGIKYHNTHKPEPQEIYKWNAKDSSFTIPFGCNQYGLMLIRGVINGKSGLFIFDTGAEISIINERFISKQDKRAKLITIYDSNMLAQSKHKFRIKSFRLGAITGSNIEMTPVDSLTWLNPKGILYKQDSIIGIIGNNIISRYTWDFDLPKKRVTISTASNYCENISDSLAIELVPQNGHMQIPVKVNNRNILATLDFGSSASISIKDSVVTKGKYLQGINISESYSGLFSHLDSLSGKNYKIDFVNVEFGQYVFNKVKCEKNTAHNLFGLPFIWAFERVVLDYRNKKSYFLSKTEKACEYSVQRISKQKFDQIVSDIVGKNNKTIIYSKPQGTSIIIKKGAINLAYIVFGKVIIYNNAATIRPDSIICCDSLLLPSGMVRYGPVDLNKISKSLAN